jgi:hypothetical protein
MDGLGSISIPAFWARINWSSGGWISTAGMKSNFLAVLEGHFFEGRSCIRM